MIEQKAFEVSQDFLLGLKIVIVVETLKCEGQYPNSMHVLAMLMNFLRHATFLRYFLRYLHDNLSSSEVDKLLYLAIALVNSSSEKKLYFITSLFTIS